MKGVELTWHERKKSAIGAELTFLSPQKQEEKKKVLIKQGENQSISFINSSSKWSTGGKF